MYIIYNLSLSLSLSLYIYTCIYIYNIYIYIYILSTGAQRRARHRAMESFRYSAQKCLGGAQCFLFVLCLH